MAEALVITGEDDLWTLLEQFEALAGLGIAPTVEAETVQVAGWNPELLYFPDEPIGHTVSPTIARAITGFHNSLSRSYAYVAYGRANAQVLRAEDRDALELKILVLEGSNVLEVAEGAIDKLVKGLVGKMTGKQVTAVFAALLLLYFSVDVTKHWMDKEYEAKQRGRESRERVEMSEQETKRMELMARVLDKFPQIKPIAELADESKETLTRAVTETEHARVLHSEITGDQARVILSKPREQGRGQRLDGDYEVAEIDIDNPDGWMARLRHPETKEEFPVAINRAELPAEDIQALFKSVEDKKAIHALVNAYFVGGKITAATVVRANEIEPKEDK